MLEDRIGSHGNPDVRRSATASLFIRCFSVARDPATLRPADAPPTAAQNAWEHCGCTLFGGPSGIPALSASSTLSRCLMGCSAPFSTWAGEDSVVAVPTLLNGWIYPSLWRSHYWRPGAAHTVDQHTGAR